MEKDPLFDLIKALNPTEKRYFNLHHQGSEQKGFMRLFRYLDAQEVYQEAALKDFFAGEKFIRNLPVIKSYLKNALLQSLGDFHLQNQVDFQLRRQLDYVQVLYQKGLRALCLREVRKVKRGALAIGASMVLVEALKMEIRLLRFKPQGAKEIGELRRQMMAAIHSEQLEAEASALFDQVFHLLLERVHHTQPEVQSDIQALGRHAHELLQQEGVTVQGQLILTQCLIHCEQMVGHPAQVLAHYRQLLGLFHSHPAFTKARPIMALKSYRGFLESCLLLNSFDGTEEALHALEALPLKGNALKAESAAAKTYFKLKQAIQMERFDQAADLEGEVRQLFRDFPGLVPDSYQISFWYELAVALVLDRRYPAAKEWLRSILMEPLSEIRKDIREFARMVQLLVWFEFGEMDLLEFNVRNTERMLQRRNRFTEVDGLLLRFFRRTLQGLDAAALALEMDQLQTGLVRWQAEGVRHLGLELFLKWLEGKRETK